MLSLFCPFGVQGTSSSSQLDKYRHWHDDQCICSLVTFANQPRNRKQKYLFHRDSPCFENKRSAQQDWKWGKNDWTFTMSTFIPTHQGAKVRQRPSLVLSLANDFLQRTLMLQDIFYLRHERVTRKMTMLVSNVSVCYTFFRERNNGRIRTWRQLRILPLFLSLKKV